MIDLLINPRLVRLGMMTNKVHSSSSSKSHHRKIVGNNHIFIRFGHKEKADHAIRMGNRALESMQKRNDLMSHDSATTAATTQASTTSRAQTNAIISKAIPYELRASTTFDARFRKFGPLSPTEKKTELQDALIEKQSCLINRMEPPSKDFQNPRNVPEATEASNATATMASQVEVTNEYIRQKHLPSVEASIVEYTQKSEEYPTHEFANHVIFIRGVIENAVGQIMVKRHIICMQVLKRVGNTLYGPGIVLSSVDRTEVNLPKGCVIIENGNDEHFLKTDQVKETEYSLSLGDQRILDFATGKNIQNGLVPEFLKVFNFSYISKVMLNGVVVKTSTAFILEAFKGEDVHSDSDPRKTLIDFQDLLIKEREEFWLKSAKSIPSTPISGLSNAKKEVWRKKNGGGGSGSNGNESGGGTNET